MAIQIEFLLPCKIICHEYLTETKLAIDDHGSTQLFVTVDFHVFRRGVNITSI